jgi:hypothetical protein
MRVPAFRGVAAWLVEIDRQARLMRPRRPLYDRFDATARLLTADRIRSVAIVRLSLAFWSTSSGPIAISPSSKPCAPNEGGASWRAVTVEGGNVGCQRGAALWLE